MDFKFLNTENLDMETLWEMYILPWGINLISALLIFYIGRLIAKGIVKVVKKLLTRSNMDAMLVNFIASILSALLLLFVIIAALSQLGIDTTSLVALVGAAGIAIGLALKDSLQNFAAGVMLIIFKPFKVGDFVDAAGVMGIVESVGIFSSAMRTGDNKAIIIPNGSIYQGTITNYSAKPTRRVDMVFGIGYDDDIKLAKEILERLLAEDERVLKDPAPVVALSELGDSSVNFIARPWVNSGDYWAVAWEMNEKVKTAFDEAGISIPYPQMDIHLNHINSTQQETL